MRFEAQMIHDCQCTAGQKEAAAIFCESFDGRQIKASVQDGTRDSIALVMPNDLKTVEGTRMPGRIMKSAVSIGQQKRCVAEALGYLPGGQIVRSHCLNPGFRRQESQALSRYRDRRTQACRHQAHHDRKCL